MTLVVRPPVCFQGRQIPDYVGATSARTVLTWSIEIWFE